MPTQIPAAERQVRTPRSFRDYFIVSTPPARETRLACNHQEPASVTNRNARVEHLGLFLPATTPNASLSAIEFFATEHAVLPLRLRVRAIVLKQIASQDLPGANQS